MTSSRMRRELCSSRSPLVPCRKPSLGGMNPALPMMGSVIMAATSPSFALRASSIASRSLKGTRMVFRVTSSGIPAESGTLWVRAPEPAFTRTLSWAPWKAPSTLMILSRPVYPLASLTAFMVASVPVLTHLILSTLGTWEVMNLAYSTSIAVGVPKHHAPSSLSCTACLIAGCP